MRKLVFGGMAVLLLLTTCGLSLADEKIAPSVAVKNVQTEIRNRPIKTYEEYQAALKELATAQLPLVQSENLEKEEQLRYGDLLDMAGKKDEALGIYDALARGEGMTACFACKKLMDAAAESKDYKKLEYLINGHRNRFPLTPEDPSALFNQVMALAQHYSESGDSAKAVDTILAELKSLNFDYPYTSFNVLAYAGEDFEKAGRNDEYLALLREYQGKFDAILASRAAAVPTDEAEKKAFDQATTGWKRLSGGYKSTLLRAELIGTEAPDFTLNNYFNTEPVTLKDLRGKVVMVDFWANWCGPCKAAFPSMAELYAEHKDAGFVILGVTSFQGYFADGDVREGMQKRDLSNERELELTKDFIAKHKMTWPIAFSSRGCFDPEYGVQGIPTFAVIDKQGKIRMIQVGSGPESEAKLKVLIPKLLAE